ncbi:hypothetical protein F5884DRAFT_821607 [Xylogone sp. PMI_703]|nr:hypothetical protein F5884DRAFT_821607 [Xylogone sp. PMI_703]
MPRPEPPPTPGSSTEIKGKDGSHFSSLQMSFELPPPAISGVESSSSSASHKSSSASSYHPTSPLSPALPASEIVKIRRRSSVAQPPAKDTFALPPPPTRSRKIIQMKPRGQAEEPAEAPTDGAKNNGKAAAAPKKKQPSSTSIAGRKIARKTAHSLIERRRRSKMNEEFGVLKDMIPACTGEMHKLAILQASIDYIRYLEDCVAKLKAENARTDASAPASEFAPPTVKSRGSYSPHHNFPAQDKEEDVEMDGSDSHSASYSTPMANMHQFSVSPALGPQDSRSRQASYSSASTDHRHYSYSASSTTSPALGPSAYDYPRGGIPVGSALTSPTLLPQRDLDQEATAALLMLNTDRRGTTGSASGRGMSVKDLLSA